MGENAATTNLGTKELLKGPSIKLKPQSMSTSKTQKAGRARGHGGGPERSHGRTGERGEEKKEEAPAQPVGFGFCFTFEFYFVLSDLAKRCAEGVRRISFKVD